MTPDQLQPGTVTNEVLIGHDGYLFLAGGAHSVLDVLQGRQEIADASFDAFRDNILNRAAWARQNGAQFVHLVFPDKQSVLHDQWPLEKPLRLGELYIQRAGMPGDLVMYGADYLETYGPQVFSKVDTHLSDLGSFLLATHLVERLTGLPQQDFVTDFLTTVPRAEETVSGDLGSKLSPPVFATQIGFDPFTPGLFISNGLEGGNDGIVDVRVNPEAPLPYRVAIFSDSFGRELARFLHLFFKEILYCRTGAFHAEVADQYRPDILLTAAVERYLDFCTSDDEREFFYNYPYRSGVTYNPDPAFITAYSAVLSYPRKAYQEFIASVADGSFSY